MGLGLAACRAGLRGAILHGGRVGEPIGKGARSSVHRWTGSWVNSSKAHLLIYDELGYVSMSRGGVELLFRVFADRYERGSLLVTTNLPFSDSWGQIFQGERMTAALFSTGFAITATFSR